MVCDPKFAEYVDDAMNAVQLDAPELTDDKFMINVADRWVEVIFNPDRERLTFVAIAAMSDEVRFDLIGQFNVYNLFHGGYCLISPPDTGVVYLCQSHAIASVPAEDLVSRLIAFERRAGPAGNWYLTHTPEHAATTV